MKTGTLDPLGKFHRGNVGTCLNLGRFMTPFANSERPKRLLRRPNASIKLRQGVAQWEYRCGASATEGGDELAPLSKSKNLMVMKSRSHVAECAQPTIALPLCCHCRHTGSRIIFAKNFDLNLDPRRYPYTLLPILLIFTLTLSPDQLVTYSALVQVQTSGSRNPCAHRESVLVLEESARPPNSLSSRGDS
jgi:hypothetical protein